MILGIDPGTVVTGWGLIRQEEVIDFGCIRPKGKLSERYRTLHEGVKELIVRYQPEAVAIETQYVKDNVQSALKLGMARGVIVLAATLAGIPVFEYAPTQVKKAVTGRGQASKIQVQKMIAALFGLKEVPEPEDAADALACAICHAHHRKFQRLLGEI